MSIHEFKVVCHPKKNDQVIFESLLMLDNDGVGFVCEPKSYDPRRCHVSSRWTHIGGGLQKEWKVNLLRILYQYTSVGILQVYYNYVVFVPTGKKIRNV